MVADILPVLISLSNSLNYSFTSHFFHFGGLIWSNFAAVENSSSNPCFYVRRLSFFQILC